MNLNILDYKKTIFGLPFFLIFVINLIITRLEGFEYAGDLAIFTGISTFISMIFSNRWDVEMLVKKEEYLSNSLSNGIYSVIFLGTISLIFYYLTSLIEWTGSFNVLLIYTAILVALYELHINVFLKKEKFLFFITLRSLPHLLLIVFVLLEFSPSFSWFFAFLISVIFILLSIRLNFREMWNFSSNHLKALKSSRRMIIPSISALIANSITVFWLLIISIRYGSSDAGVWINAYRISSLPIAFCGAVIMPLVLLSIGQKEFYKEKFKEMFNFSYLLVFVLLILALCLFLKGDNIFNFLTKSNDLIGNITLLSISIIAFIQFFMQYWKELFQSINRNLPILIILAIELLLTLLIYFGMEVGTFSNFINLILGITVLCLTLMLTLITISYSKLKPLKSLVNAEDLNQN